MINDEYLQKYNDRIRVNLLNINSYIFKNLKNFNIPLKDFLKEFERQIIEHALLLTNGHQKRAALLLGVKESTFCEKIKKYKILSDNHKKSDISLLNYKEIISPFLEDQHLS